MSKGVVYCVTGTELFRYEEAVVSARSIRKVAPDLSITLFTDYKDYQNEAFDQVLPVESHLKTNPFFRRIQAINRSPYNETLALDSDTFIIDPSIMDVFTLLDRFDMAAAHTPIRKTTLVEEIPLSFTQFNCGVILFKKSESTQSMLMKWEELMANGDLKWRQPDDQGCFRHCLWHSDVRIATLSSEFNLRTPYPGFLGEGGKAVIIHGKEYEYEEVSLALNRELCNRIVLPSVNYFFNGGVIVTEKSKFYKLLKLIGDTYLFLTKMVKRE